MSGRHPVRSSRLAAAAKREEQKKNVFVVEKVLNKRNGRQGQVEFLIKWQGFSEAENTWEPRENLRCSEMLEKFEREYAKRQSRKRRHSPQTRQSPEAEASSSSAVQWPPAPPIELWGNKSLRTIIGITKAAGELNFLCKFNDETVYLLPSKDVSMKFPNQVIRFYESRLSLADSKPDDS